MVQRQRKDDRQCTHDVEVEILDPSCRPCGERADWHRDVAVVWLKESLNDDQRREHYRPDDAREDQVARAHFSERPSAHPIDAAHPRSVDETATGVILSLIVTIGQQMH